MHLCIGLGPRASCVGSVDEVVARLHALRGIRAGSSIDDFCAGDSSLAHLKRLPLCQLKIVQAFVRDILFDGNEAAIPRMVMALADRMGLAVIAEGVETVAQRDFLAGLGSATSRAT